MPPALTPQTFVDRWASNTLNERAVAQSHFNELCQLLGQPTPNEADPQGRWYRFEKPLSKAGGGAGFADVWRDGYFVWEYKTKGKSLDLARQQILNYRGDLGNPPVIVLSDIERYEVHIDFTGHKTRVEKFTNADLLNADRRELLRTIFTDPERLRPSEKTADITTRIAAEFAQSATWVERRGYDPQRVAHFFMKLLFSMFAEDIGLLPNHLLRNSIRAAILKPDEFEGRIRALFHTMRDGGYFGMDQIRQFNGGLFDDDDVIPLTPAELEPLSRASWQDWRNVEPSIFGTLFERSLDPDKRSELGAHYTSRDDILLLVEPVLMHPLRREWATVQATIEALRPAYDAATGAAKQRQRNQIEQHILTFLERLSTIKVLDPACGSGNFLYVALHALKDLESEVITYAVGIGLEQPEQSVGPQQLLGIERSPFAAELAQVVVWIGNLQWDSKHGYWNWPSPVLQTLHTIECRDAILAFDANGKPVEPQWPAADVIVGNPPFLGGYKMRQELGWQYVDALFTLYDDRVPAPADLVCYWFERARARIEAGHLQRAGLLATNSIRGGANRRVLERIKQSGDIFMAWSDRPWILDGAAVRVSMVGFDKGHEQDRQLDGIDVLAIHANLTASLNLTQAHKLKENFNIAFSGTKKGGPFDIPEELAQQFIRVSNNPNGRPNSDVVRPWVNGQALLGKPQNTWIIDFGVGMSEAEARLYEAPFEYVRKTVYPQRQNNNRASRRANWWLHSEMAPALRAAVRDMSRYIATPRVAKHRVFVWIPVETLPDDGIYIFARDDDYFFGVLHSRLHEMWSLRMGTYLGVGNDPRYTPTTTFETFPFPWPPRQEPAEDPRVEAIADAARELVRLRDEWLNPAALIAGASLKDRTLTNLYNKRPDWLTDAHRALDQAVLDAYGWPHALTDDEILARLLALNLERAAAQAGPPQPAGDATLNE